MLSRDGEHAEPASWSGPPSKQPVVTHSYLRNRWCCPGYSAMNQVSTPIVLWAKMHRIHHKYSDTTSDPHDARRGFFFSHIGWLLSTKHPDFLAKMKEVRLRAALGLALTSAQEVRVQCLVDTLLGKVRRLRKALRCFCNLCRIDAPGRRMFRTWKTTPS